jgi:hypothetical protein
VIRIPWNLIMICEALFIFRTLNTIENLIKLL